jgi:hypothetical protein
LKENFKYNKIENINLKKRSFCFSEKEEIMKELCDALNRL